MAERPMWAPELAAACAALPVDRMRVTFEAKAAVALPPYTGSMWRGVFGNGLRRICGLSTDGDDGASPEDRNKYRYLFETGVHGDGADGKRYRNAPVPYVIRPLSSATALAAGDIAALDVVLVGYAIEYADDVVAALDVGAGGGVGKGRGSMRVVNVERLPTDDLNGRDATRAILSLELTTPLRLRADNRYVSPERFEFSMLSANLLRRLLNLYRFHTDATCEIDEPTVLETVTEIKLTRADLNWTDWSRYSARQGRSVQMGGLTGRIALQRVDVEPVLPLLRIGERVHAGSGTSLGLGRLRLIDDGGEWV